MQEQKKNFFKKKKNKRTKFLRYKPFIINPIIYKSFKFLKLKKKTLKKINKILIIKVIPNNIFFTLINNFSKNQIFISSSGKEKIKVSKKKLKFIFKIFLQICLKKVKKYISNNIILVKILAPIKLRKNIIKLISRNVKKSKIFFLIKPLKCFNGCKVKKKKRTKKKSFRIFK